MLIVIWFLFLVIHLGFTILLASAFKRKDCDKATDPFLDLPSVSIVIASKNEEENLRHLVPLLLKQNYASFEIIIALDRCNDQSGEFLQSVKTGNLKFVTIHDLPAEWNGKKYALKKAIEVSTGEWLLFTDADCRPETTNWIAEMLKARTAGSEIVLGYSPYRFLKNNLLNRYIHFESFITAFLYLGNAQLQRPYMGVGRNFVLKRDTYESIGGYESIKGITGGDDDLLINQVANPNNTSISFHPESIVTTFPKKTWKSYFNQKIRHLSVGGKYKTRDRIFLSSYHLTHLGIYLLLFTLSENPRLFVFFIFYQVIKGISYSFVSRQTGDQISLIWIPIVDLLHAFLTPMIAIKSNIEKDIQWTKN